MSFQRPNLTTLISRIQGDMEIALPGVDPRLRRNAAGVFAKALAGTAHGLHGRLDWLGRNLLPDKAAGEILDRWATIWLPQGRKAAVGASGGVVMTGVDGASAPAGTVFQRSDGWKFQTNDVATIAAGTAIVAVTAVIAGKNSNTGAGSAFSLVSPISGINSAATVDSIGLTGGADIESDDDLRTRILKRIQTPPRGGSAADYEDWALEVPGVTRAWAYAGENGIGTVVVRFMMDDVYTDGIPQAADVATVQAYIDTIRPIGAGLTVSAPIAVPMDVTMQLSPNDATTQSNVIAEIDDLLRRNSMPGGTIYLSHIQEAVSTAEGETDHVLSIPSGNVTHTNGQIAVRGAFTWQ